MSESKKLRKDDLQIIAKGATFLASGGGGTYASMQNIIDNFVDGDYYDKAEVELISRGKAIADGGYTCVVAYIGAPEAIAAAKYPDAGVNAVNAIMEKLKKEGKELKNVVPVEIGAVSSIIPLTVAAKVGLRVVDGDGAKRAVPSLPMLTYAAANISTDPTFMTNSDGFSVQINVQHKEGGDHWWQEQNYMAEAVDNLARPIIGLDAFGEIAGLAIWVMDDKQLEKALPITGTMELCHKMGEEIIRPDFNAQSAITYLNNKCNMQSYIMFEGTFDKDGVTVTTGGGFDHGRITITNKDANTQAVTLYQNETLIGWDSDKALPLAMAPDSLAFFVEDEQKVYSNGDVVVDGELVEGLEGKKVTLIGIKADPVLLKRETQLCSLNKESEPGIILKSFQEVLANLGYAGKYIPIDEIWGK